MEKDNKIENVNNEFKNIKDKVENFENNYNKQGYTDCAKVIVGVKLIGHIIYHLPKAYKEKKNSINNNENSNPLYKKNSVFDYIEEPNFEYDDEVKKVADNIEKKATKLDEGIKNIQQKTSIFYWIKKFINKITKKDTRKLLVEKSNSENKFENQNETKKDRDNFRNSIIVNPKKLAQNENKLENETKKELNNDEFER